MNTYKITVIDKYGDKMTFKDVIAHNLFVDSTMQSYISVTLSSGVKLSGSFVSLQIKRTGNA